MSELHITPVFLVPAEDGRQSETARAVQRGVGRLLRDLGFAMLTEVTLASGRRADIMALGPQGEIWIVEIKSSPADYHADSKWPEYRAYCDRLFFAVPPTLDHVIMPADAGLLVADAYGAELLRQPESHPLPAARRKAVTIAFARVAAQRLHGLWDPAV